MFWLLGFYTIGWTQHTQPFQTKELMWTVCIPTLWSLSSHVALAAGHVLVTYLLLVPCLPTEPIGPSSVP